VNHFSLANNNSILALMKEPYKYFEKRSYVMMFGFDPQHTRFNSDEHILSPMNVSRLVPFWTASIGDRIDSSPAVANRVVYVGSWDHKLYAFYLP
jgi:PQQ-like domain